MKSFLLDEKLTKSYIAQEGIQIQGHVLGFGINDMFGWDNVLKASKGSCSWKKGGNGTKTDKNEQE